MKINAIMAIVSLLISALAGYGFFAGTHLWLYTIGAALCFFLTLGVLLGVGIKSDARLGVNIKIVAGIFFAVLLVEQLIFAFIKTQTPYIIVTGILLLLYFIICYKIAKSTN